ncbi:DNA translocase FtsK [Egicoccus sp. AB-alg2]|uniref:DNA translocase FtsK n=1 Tax=Egicoccus sp. AB-alg2 TaxID=3242693 RepID=UPI00359D36C0
MASTTKNPPKKKARGKPAARRPSRGSTARGRGGRSGGGGRGSGRGGATRKQGTVSKAGSAVGEHLSAQKQDALGIFLILLGVLTGLGTYADAAGPVGSFLEAVALGLLGLLGYAVPVLLAWFGLLVVIGRPSPEIGRIGVGAVLLGIGVLGGLHLLAGGPEPADGVRGLWLAGGLLGWAIGRPLTAALSVWGAGAVVVAFVSLGLLVVTKTPFSAVIDAVRGVFTREYDDEVDDDTAASPATDPDVTQKVAKANTSRRRKAAAAADDAPDDTQAEQSTEAIRPTRVRATLANKAYEQPALAEDDADDGSTAADRLAGRAPDPPVERAKVPVDPATLKAAKVAPVQSWDDYSLPPMDLLAGGKKMGKESTRTIEAQTAALQETFDQFGIDATVARWSRGPTVTRFEIELGPGVQVKKVANMGDDIAYALAAPDVRIVAPIPGKSAIGVEVPNRQRDLITLGDILRSPEAQRDPHPLTVSLGVDIAGNPALVNLATMPHLLVSGATGSGKSVTLNGMITSIIMRARPDQVRMILIDPKRVELNGYEGTPHLLSPVVTDPRRAADAVQWCVKEMEQRYELLALLGFRNIDGYNDAVRAGEVAPRPGRDGEEIVPEELPYILLVIDELADLMLVAPRDVEDAICRIAQMARAVGIHMVIATQRPSVDVITGLIKANIPSRLALAVASQTDSRTILDMGGAEKLVGKGDMLFLPASQGKPSRLQGCWVTEREVVSAVTYCKQQREAEFEETVVKTGEDAERADSVRSGDDDSDEALLRRAAEQVVVSGLGSTSMLQRKLRIGFARAGRLMDELEELGVVGPNEGSKARDVLWTPEQLDEARSAGHL